MHDFDVVVLGAGAAGLVAAARAAECGVRVLLAEKNRRPGVKILMSGGTRCNITNARGLRRLDVVSGPVDPGLRPQRVTRHPGHSASLRRATARSSPRPCGASTSTHTIAMFEEAGVATKVEANGKIFPVSDKAAQVLDALVAATRALGSRAALLGCRRWRSIGLEELGSAVCREALGGDRHGPQRDRRRRAAARTRDAGPPATAMRSHDGSATRSSSPGPRLFRCESQPTGSPTLRGSAFPMRLPRSVVGAKMLAIASRGRAVHPPRTDRPGDPRRQPRGGAAR